MSTSELPTAAPDPTSGDPDALVDWLHDLRTDLTTEPGAWLESHGDDPLSNDLHDPPPAVLPPDLLPEDGAGAEEDVDPESTAVPGGRHRRPES